MKHCTAIPMEHITASARTHQSNAIFRVRYILSMYSITGREAVMYLLIFFSADCSAITFMIKIISM